MLALIAALSACVETSTPPYIGECAVYPDGIYDYGELGIGSCLAGPVSLDWLPHPTETNRYYLAVANANPYLDFQSGSLVSIDVDAVPLDGSTTPIHTVAASALEMPSFPGYAAHVADRDLLLVTNRLSEDARTRVGFDDLYFVDVSDPAALNFAPVAQTDDGLAADHLELMSDPDPLAYDPSSGYAYVANLTSHTISVVDVLAEPVEIIDAVGDADLSEGWFLDADLSGSRVDVVDLDVVNYEAVLDEQWSVDYAEGEWRLWIPNADGVYRIVDRGGQDWLESGLGYEMSRTEALDDFELPLGEFEDPQPWLSGLGTRMVYLNAASGTVEWAQSGAYMGEWAYMEDPLLAARDGEWDAALGGPHITANEGTQHLFYDGVDGSGVGGIGLATSTDGETFARLSDDPVVAAGAGAHDAVRAADPFVLYDDAGWTWRMYYGAWDGATWTIGHATSTDLETWTADDAAIFSLDPTDDPSGFGAAAPVVTRAGGELRMWTTRQDAAGAWAVGLATSTDGDRWTDQGIVAEIDGVLSSGEPPGVGLQSEFTGDWTLSGELEGLLPAAFEAGEAVVFSDYGFSMMLSSGALLSPGGAPAEIADDWGEAGVSPGSWLVDEGWIFLTLTDALGDRRIGVADWNDGEPEIRGEILLEGEAGSFDAEGVFSPAVFPLDGGYAMLYAGAGDGQVAIGLATSADGITWTTDHQPVFEPGEDWDSIQVEPGSVVQTDGGWALWYSGNNGSRTRIGLATSTDGRAWTRVAGPTEDWHLGTGSPGEFDDASVSGPFVIRGADAEHLWYTASDGDALRVGYASRPLDGGEFVRVTDPLTEEPRPALDGFPGAFDSAAALRPVVTYDDAAGYTALYTGLDGSVPRGGLAVGLAPDALYRQPRSPTAGDYVRFSSFLGDSDDEQAISLEQTIEGAPLSGVGVSQVLHDPARGFLYVASKLASYIYVIDVRDDSAAYFDDTNYLGIEAVIAADTTAGATGFRGMLVPDSGDVLYAVNDAPESVMILDLSQVEDDAVSNLVPDDVIGYLVAPRAGERDEGSDTLASVGPTSLVQRGDLLFVANFNANSIGVYDLRLGNYGALVAEVEQVGENPHAMSLSPDQSLLAVANYTGDLSAGRADSSIALIDVDPSSPTYLEILAWIANQ